MKKYFPNIDALRTCALVSVFLFHSFPAIFKGGFIGVDMFFVLTGFLTLVRSGNTKGAEIPGFYKKKILRLYPAMIVMVFVTCAAVKFLIPSAAYGLKGETMSIFGGYYNFHEIIKNSDYFASIGAASPFTHMWTIAVELQFYLIFPLIVFIIRKLSKEDRTMTGFIVILSLSLGALISPIIAIAEANQSILYYSTFTRSFPIFAGLMGGLIYCGGNEFGIHVSGLLNRFPLIKIGFYMLNTAIIMYLLLNINGYDTSFYMYGNTFISMWFMMLVLIAAADRQQNAGISRVFHVISVYSFEIYLFQYPAIFICNQTIKNFAMSKLMAVAITIIASICCKVFINNMASIIREVKSRSIKSDVRKELI